jgi:hypothetical protein
MMSENPLRKVEGVLVGFVFVFFGKDYAYK